MDSNNSRDEKPNKRIRVACDNCRRKKIKCDGQFPCGNCQQSNAAGCNYDERIDKKGKPTRVSKRVSNAKTIEILDSRLSKLESVLLKLADKLDSGGNEKVAPNSDDLKENEEREDSDDTTSIDYGEEEDQEDGRNQDGCMCEGGNRNFVRDHQIGRETRSRSEDQIEDNGTSKANYTPKRLEQFFGAHSIISIFSDKSLEWIESTMRPEDQHLINPIRNLPFIFYIKTKSFIQKWVDPPLIDASKKKKLLQKPFPENSRLIFDFIDNYYEPYSAASCFCEIEYVKDLFQTYYGINNKNPRKFKCSELMIMSVVLCLCISCKIDEDTSSLAISPDTSCSANTPATIQSISNDDLLALQEELLDNTIFYYHRVLVISEGIETIQGILLLVIYIESSWITSHVNYMLLSVAIRFALEMGLHRQETYDNLSENENRLRKLIWWCCYCFDIEICFRGGKPPLINASDVSTKAENEFNNYLQSYGMLNKGGNLRLNIMNNRELFHCFFKDYMLSLSDIRAKSYNSLFVASAEIGSFECLLTVLQSLNEETLKLADSVDPSLKPRFYNDPEFQNIFLSFDSPNTKSLLTVHFSHFSHLMVMNRIPFMVGNPHVNNSELGMSMRNLFLDSARTILVLAKNMPRVTTGLSFYNWVVFFPSTAFLSLLAACINHPEAPETYNDVKLLADCSMNFFSHKGISSMEGFSRLQVYQSRNSLISLIMKVLLKIVIRIFETRTGISFLNSNEALRQHLESAKINFPDIFKDPKKFSSQFKSFLSASFGTQGLVKIHAASPFSSMKSFDRSPSSTSSLRNSNTFINRDDIANNENIQPKQPYPNSMSPDLSNILHPNNSNDNFMNDDSISDYINDDGLTSMIYSQMNSLPNFFFDNNLGI